VEKTVKPGTSAANVAVARPPSSAAGTSGAPSARSLLKSLAWHLLALILLMLIPAEALRSTVESKELEVVFYRARPKVEVPVIAALPPGTEAAPIASRRDPGGRPAPPIVPHESRLSDAEAPGSPDLPPVPEAAAVKDVSPQEKVGNVGILAFRDKIASLSRDKVVPRLGADARYSAADDVGAVSSRSALTTSAAGSSGGINGTSLSRTVGGGGTGSGRGGGRGGGGDGAGGSGGGLQGVQVGRATSSIAGIGGDDRPKARAGAGAARTDEEIQIVFDRHKSSFYRLYNRELRNDPTLKGQIIVRLTIEPDGSVSMCELQSSDMNAPDLIAQVISRVKTMNFGPKEGVPAVTIVYPIDFLPAA
jgi:uncharacterized membrane protein YgcG